MSRAARLCAVAASAVAAAGCGGGSEAPADAEQALAAHLTERDLSFRWVACTPAADAGISAPVYRCNVNFGDPHVQAYCAAFVDGELRAAEWPQAVRGRQDRATSARACARTLAP